MERGTPVTPTGTGYPSSGTIVEGEPSARLVWSDDGFADVWWQGNRRGSGSKALFLIRGPGSGPA